MQIPTLRAFSWRHGSSRALHVLAGLFVLVLGLVLADAATRLLVPDGFDFMATRWNVDRDGSYLEILGYVVTGLASALLVHLALRRRGTYVLMGWAVVLAVVVADDALMWHERGGEWLTQRLQLPAPAGLRSQDVGELTVWAIMGLAALVLLATLHRKSTAGARRGSWGLAVLMTLLVVPAVGVDMLYVAVDDMASGRVLLLLAYLEAAGEAAALAAVLAFCLHLRSAWRPEGSTGSGASEEYGSYGQERPLIFRPVPDRQLRTDV